MARNKVQICVKNVQFVLHTLDIAWQNLAYVTDEQDYTQKPMIPLFSNIMEGYGYLDSLHNIVDHVEKSNLGN